MILWLASLSYFAVTLVLAHRLGASRARFWLLAIAPLIGAMIGLGIAVPIGNPGSTPFEAFSKSQAQEAAQMAERIIDAARLIVRPAG